MLRHDLAGDELDDVGRDRDRALLRLGPEDRDARLQVRRGQVGDEAPLEPAPEPLLERQDRLGRPVGAQDDLLAVLVDRVERVEELLLGPLLVGDELDVVDEEEVDPPVAGPELVDLALLDRGDELVRELLGRRVDDALARELGGDLVADGVHQVGLAEAHAAVQEERVVGVARALRHRQARRVGEAVGRPDDEVRERVAGVDVASPRPRRRRDRARRGPGATAWRARRALRAPGQQLGARRPAARPPRPSSRPVPSAPSPAAAAVVLGRSPRVRGRDDEVDLDAVADDPAERLGDQRAVAALQPVLGEAVRDGDPEARVVDLDERGVAQPGLEVRGREGYLELAEGGAPDLLRVHRSMWTLCVGDGLNGLPLGCGCAGGANRAGLGTGGRAGRRGFGGRKIAPPPGRPQGKSAILPGSIGAIRHGREPPNGRGVAAGARWRSFDAPEPPDLSSAGR